MFEKSPSGFRRVFRRELIVIAHRPGLAFMLGPFPLFIIFLMAAVFSSGLSTDLPITVVDLDGTSASRQVVRMIDATSGVEVTSRLPTLKEAKQELLSGRSYAVVLIPDNMERDLLAGRSPELVTLYNNQLLTIGGIVSRATATAFNTFKAGAAAQTLIARGQVLEEARVAIRPVPVQQSPLFNPSLDYVQFLLAALIPTILQIFIASSAALSVARDAQHVRGLPRLLSLGGGPVRTILGKFAPYVMAYLLSLLVADAVMFGLLGATFNGNLFFHVIYTIGFTLACIFLGGLLGVIAGETVGAFGMTAVLTAPALGFAGISLPRITMNTFAWAWGGLLPLTPYLQLRTDQVLRGAPVDVSLSTFGWLMAQVVIYGLSLLIMLHIASKPKRVEETEA